MSLNCFLKRLLSKPLQDITDPKLLNFYIIYLYYEIEIQKCNLYNIYKKYLSTFYKITFVDL